MKKLFNSFFWCKPFEFVISLNDICNTLSDHFSRKEDTVLSKISTLRVTED